MTDNEKSSEIAERVRRKIAEELLRRGLDPSVIFPAGKNTDGKDSRPEPKFPNSNESSVTVTSDSLSTEDKVVRARDRREEHGGDDFWDLGSPKERKYERPNLSESSLTPADVSSDNENDNATRTGEKIPPRENYPSQTMNPFTSLKPQYRTSSYKRKPPVRQAPQPIQKPPVEPPKVYEKHGALISKITVESWSGEMDFYTRFALDAEKSHLAKPQRPNEELKPAQFYSLVPQYSHMTGAQTEYYRRLREFWRHGKHPDCDSAYVMLYIFELLNLGSVDKSEIARALTSVWLGYRERMPRLDSYMCEWLEDFCMINDLPLPDEIFTHISEIAAKAHFKEYYFDAMLSEENRLNLAASALAVQNLDTRTLAASALIDCYSDYVFSASKYYGENREKYDRYIPLAVSAVLDEGLKQKRGIFACDKSYKIVVDTFIGCAVSSDKKKRVKIEFTSFLRGIETREYVTALVKYSENVLRRSLGIKAKLGVKSLDEWTTAIVDSFFAPLMPKEKVKKPADEMYMPDGYLKNYEAETSGFDFDTAAEIERLSWANTARLTASEDEEKPAESGEAAEESEVSLDGEISSDIYDTAVGDNTDNKEENPQETDEPPKEPTDENFMRSAAMAALDGRFREWAKESGYYEGEAQDRVNTYFLDIIGDVILEDFTFIEDYREDIEEWMK